jgi:outer membrane protein insertion porin family
VVFVTALKFWVSLGVASLCVLSKVALAQPAAGDALLPPPQSEHGNFGPRIMIESIAIRGNSTTRSEIILRALDVQPGDILPAGDSKLRDAKFKILALGFFRDVTLSLRRGSDRGSVVLVVNVSERGTISLNRLWFGASALTKGWLGADISERNLFGTGITVGGAFVAADTNGDLVGGRNQWATELRIGIPNVYGSHWGVQSSASLAQGAEAYRIDGDGSDNSVALFQAFPYRRTELRGAATYDLSALTRVTLGASAELIDAYLPLTPVRALSDGRLTAIDLHLQDGSSRNMSVSAAFERDTRPDAVLPHAGSRLVALASLGSSLFGGNYNYAVFLGRYEHWWPVGKRSAIGLRTGGGVIVGQAPRFDQLHVSDLNRMAPPRAMGLSVAASPSVSFLPTRADKPVYGSVGGSVGVEYAWNVFRSGSKRVYGGDLFIGAGLWGLADAEALRPRDASLLRSLPVDIFLDAGLRIDTDVGAFEFTIANLLGRLPL